MDRWKSTVEQFLQVTDKLGKPIDQGIFETVVALNVLGIHTVQSCEGHLGWGVPYPWIHIESDLDQKFRLHQLLVQFYRARATDFDSVLAFNGYRLHSQGGAFSTLYSSEEQKHKLRLYQTEMSAFTSYLKTLLSLP